MCYIKYISNNDDDDYKIFKETTFTSSLLNNLRVVQNLIDHLFGTDLKITKSFLERDMAKINAYPNRENYK